MNDGCCKVAGLLLPLDPLMSLWEVQPKYLFGSALNALKAKIQFPVPAKYLAAAVAGAGTF